MFKTPSHRSPVGVPLASAPYRAKTRYEAGTYEGPPLRATDSPIVLRTVGKDGAHEFRVGHFKSEAQLQVGLTRQHEESIVLNREVVLACFGGSPLYASREDAIEGVGKLYPLKGGVKVLRYECEFPSLP